MRLRDRLLKGSALNFIAVIFNQGSTLIANILVARILLRQGFGEYAMLQSTLLMMASLAQVAMTNTASKYVAEYRSSDLQRVGRIFGMCVVVSLGIALLGVLILILASSWLATVMLNAPYLASPLILGAGFLFFFTINGYQIGALSGLEAYLSLAKAGVISGIFAVLAISLGAYCGGLKGALIGLSVSALLRYFVHNYWLKKELFSLGVNVQYRDCLKLEKSIICKFALPWAIAGYYSVSMGWLANSFLAHQSNGYDEMALYVAANNFRIIVLFLPNVINTVGRSILINEKLKGDRTRYYKIFNYNILLMFLVCLGAAIFIGCFGRSILQVFGNDFKAGSSILWILLIGSIFEGLTIALHQHIQAHAKIWRALFTVNIPREALLVLLAYFLVKIYGGVGLAIAYLGGTIIGLIATVLIVVSLSKNNFRTELEIND